MGIFSKKQEINLEDFCRDFYESQILRPEVAGIDLGNECADMFKQSICEVYPDFDRINPIPLRVELWILRFELFALAWTHKFVSGKAVVAQSAFTKNYLQEEDMDDIWDRMEKYNRMIHSVTLHRLSDLGRVNLGFNHSMKESMIAKNVESAKELGISDDDIIERANKRVWSETAWRQKLILLPLAFVLCENLGLKLSDLNEEARFRLATLIKGLYDGAQQSWDNVRIKA